jgi:2-polyprenyl-3-methyl-5-hydroxy-6-metoxy-1,4-benzoquinol methylase
MSSKDFLSKRVVAPEQLDEATTTEDARRDALIGLERANRLSTSVHHLWGELRRTAESCPGEPLRVLDVGTGGGDVVIRLAEKAEVTGVPMEFEGCDFNEETVGFASENAARARLSNVRFFVHDIKSADLPMEFDVVMCSLMLHHFRRPDAEQVLQRMAKAARAAVLVHDLRRSRLNYWLCWIGTRLVSRSTIVHEDGVQSVQAAFTIGEMRRLADLAGLHGATFQRLWPQRFLMVWRKGKYTAGNSDRWVGT